MIDASVIYIDFTEKVTAMENLNETRLRRTRQRLVAAAITRFTWVLLGIALIYFSNLPLRPVFLTALAYHFVQNIAGLLYFRQLGTSATPDRFKGLVIIMLVSGDTVIITLGMLITGGLQSPFVLVLPVVVSLTILLDTAARGYYVAALSTVLYSAVAALQQLELTTLPLKPYPVLIAAFYLVFAPAALFSIALLLSYVLKKMEDSEKNLYDNSLALQTSLKQVNTLKYQQDGDYYLTSILLSPFQQLQARLPEFNTESHLKQFKSFSFKNRQCELGGDLIITDQIITNEGNALVFLNADAMGKSLQGAGGALVLGALFRSILDRSDKRTDFTGRQWLVECFTEIQKIFEAFDGSMMVSMIMGIVSSESPLCLYLNAEHPGIVLYRDERAAFIPNEVSMKKAGTPGFNHKVVINEIEFLPNDILIAGSDGKDDLNLAPGAQDGQRDINFDETLFLRAVEKSGGHLPRLVEHLEKTGQLIDDLSLLKIERTALTVQKHVSEENVPAVALTADLLKSNRHLLKNQRLPEALQAVKQMRRSVRNDSQINGRLAIEICRIRLKQKRFRHALKSLQTRAGRHEYEEHLFLTAICLDRLKLPHESYQSSLQLYERNPGHNRNLIHLALMARKTGRKDLFENYRSELAGRSLSLHEQSLYNRLIVKQ